MSRITYSIFKNCMNLRKQKVNISLVDSTDLEFPLEFHSTLCMDFPCSWFKSMTFMKMVSQLYWSITLLVSANPALQYRSAVFNSIIYKLGSNRTNYSSTNQGIENWFLIYCNTFSSPVTLLRLQLESCFDWNGHADLIYSWLPHVNFLL